MRTPRCCAAEEEIPLALPPAAKRDVAAEAMAAASHARPLASSRPKAPPAREQRIVRIDLVVGDGLQTLVAFECQAITTGRWAGKSWLKPLALRTCSNATLARAADEYDPTIGWVSPGDGADAGGAAAPKLFSPLAPDVFVASVRLGAVEGPLATALRTMHAAHAAHAAESEALGPNGGRADAALITAFLRRVASRLGGDNLDDFRPRRGGGVSMSAARPSAHAAARIRGGGSPAAAESSSAFDELDDGGDMDDEEGGTVWLHPGDRNLPPLVEVSGAPLPLRRVVKPPDADALWEWQSSHGLDEADSSWASVWPAAAALAAHVDANAALVRGRAVAELGCGLGVVGLTAAAAGAATLTLLDQDPFALHCAMSTAAVCGLRTGALPTAESRRARRSAAPAADSAEPAVVSAAASDWAEVSEALAVDVVVASEVLYDATQVGSLARCVAGLLREGGTLLLADPLVERALGCRAEFARCVKELGGEVGEQPLEPAAGAQADGDGEAGGLVLITATFPDRMVEG